jgi:hypothetical protein
MSDSVKKYHELIQEGRLLNESSNQRAVGLIVEVVRGAVCAGNLDILLERVVKFSQNNPDLTPRTVFDIMSEETKVDELCTKEKQKRWNNQE